jgi:hypothetical protein
MNQHSNTVTSTTSERLATIWAIIEARKTFPAIIVVTSATESDDTEAVARGLAQAAHSVGQRTGYLRLGANSGSGIVSAPYAALSIAPRGTEREAFDAALTTWRAMYDVVIVNASVLGSGALGAHAARVSDGIVVGVCDQRRVVPADRELARLLQDLKVSVIGVVMTAPANKTATASIPQPSRLQAAPQR